MKKLMWCLRFAAGAAGAMLLVAACDYLFDTARPKVQFVTPGEADTVYSPLVLELTVQDRGFEVLELYIDGSRVKTYDSAHVKDSLDVASGEHVLSARAYDRGGNWADARIAVAVIVLAVPVLDSPPDGSVLTDSAPRFRWSYAGVAGQFELQVDNNGDFSSPAIDFTTADTACPPATALADGGYLWRVRAQGASGHWSGWSSTWGFAVAVSGIAAPTMYQPVRGDTVGDATPDFDWSEPMGAVGYWLQVDDDPYFLSPEVDEQALALSQYTPTVSLGDGRYYWRVKAQNATQVWSGWSATYDFTVMSTGVPELLEPADGAVLATSRPTFTWSRVAGTAMYWLQVDSEPSFGTPLAVSDSLADTTLVLTVDLSDGDYWWRVRSRASSGIWGGWAGARRFSIATQGPPPPALLQPANDTLLADNAPLFDWDSVPAAAQYWLQVAADDSFSPLILSRNGITAHEYKAAVPLADGTYYWRVKTANAAGGWGAWAVAWTFEVWTAPPTLSTPADGAFCWNLNDVTFGWNPVNGASTYDLQVASDSGFLLIETDTVLFSTNYSWTPGERQGLLYWRVRAAKNGMWGKWSGERRVEVGPYEVGSHDTPGQANALVVSGSYAYVADGERGLRVMKVSPPNSPVEVGFCDTPGQSEGIALAGAYACVADGDSGLRVIRITPPESPQEVGHADVPGGRAYAVAVQGNKAYMASGAAGLIVFDISDPSAPQRIGQCQTPDDAVGVALADQVEACVSAGLSGLRFVNISNPSSPTEVSSYNTRGYASAAQIVGNYPWYYIYVADGSGGLLALDVPSRNGGPNPVEVWNCPARNWVYALAVADNIHLADGEAGLGIVSGSSGQEVGNCDTPGVAHGVFAAGLYVYVADGESGLRIVKVK